jgi:hypothetical protein
LEPTEFLSLVAEISVAIAGFSGIVIALGGRRSAEWGELDRALFAMLLRASFLALGSAGFVFILLSAGLSEATTWVLGSTAWAVGYVAMAALGFTTVGRALSKGPSIHMTALTAGFAVTIGFQAANALVIRAFWPIQVALCWNIGVALYSFARLLRAGYRS